MKFMTRAGVYRASNVTFDPTAFEARSYGWWIFVKRVGQLNVFNEYAYSNTTRRHQWKVKRLLSELGVDIHASIAAPKGLQDMRSAVEHYADKIASLQTEIDRPRSHAKKNLERMQAIGELYTKIKQVKHLMKMAGAQ